MKENDENLEEISKKSKLEISMEELMSYDKKTKKELIDEEIEMKKERLLDLTV
ncbi:TPA: hypothetical protein RTH01_001500 [Campylobacter jejuni]|nr:hypothetical protein [Campylobacter jejuni]HDZ5084672.1 hypothetical protein [Campylobacter jejuni]HDZ5097597.1 hypothetical protein [Campylobacter jejuni]